MPPKPAGRVIFENIIRRHRFGRRGSLLGQKSAAIGFPKELEKLLKVVAKLLETLIYLGQP